MEDTKLYNYINSLFASLTFVAQSQKNPTALPLWTRNLSTAAENVEIEKSETDDRNH